jgi:hypothetical protein
MIMFLDFLPQNLQLSSLDPRPRPKHLPSTASLASRDE